MKKKQIEMVNYEKGTEASNLDEVIGVIRKSDNVFVLQQVVYNDKSQSITFQVHFKP